MNIEKYKGNELELIQEQVKNIKDAYSVVRVETPLLAENYSEQLVKMLIELNQFGNIKYKMNQSQITETINLLFSEFPRLSLQEYALFFRRIKTGYYGQLYESLDGIKIMAFMRDYYQEILRAYHEFKEEKHLQYKLEAGCRDLAAYYK